MGDLRNPSYDVLTELEKAFEEHHNADGRDIHVKVRWAMLYDAIVEIKRLRSLAGAVTDGPSFAEIAKDLPKRVTPPQD